MPKSLAQLKEFHGGLSTNSRTRDIANNELVSAKDRYRNLIAKMTPRHGVRVSRDKVKSMCEEEIIRISEENQELSKYLEFFSNTILGSLFELEERQALEFHEVQTKIMLLDEIIKKTKSHREEATKQPETESVLSRNSMSVKDYEKIVADRKK